MVAFSDKELKQAGDIQLRSRKIEQLLKKIVAHDRPFKQLIKEAKPYIAYNTYKNLDYFRKNRNTQGHDYSLSDFKYKKLINISDDIINELEKVIQQRTTTSDNNVNKQTDNKNNILDINNTEYNADNCKEIIITSISQIIKFLDDKGAKGIDILEKFESLKDSFPKEKYHNYLTKTNRLNHIYNLAKDKEDIGKELFDYFVAEYKAVWQGLEDLKERKIKQNINNDSKTKDLCEICKIGNIQYEIYNNGDEVYYTEKQINNNSLSESSVFTISESQRTKIRDARKELLESLEKLGGKGVFLVDKLESLKKILPQDKYKVLERQVNYVDNIWGVIVNSLYVSQENYDDFWENFEYAKKEINSISNEIKANDDGWKGCLFFIALLMLVIFIIYLFPVIITWLVWLFIINIPVIISKNGGDSGCVTTIFFFYALVGIANPLSGVIMIIVYIIEGVVLGIFNSSNDQKNKELK